MGESGCLATPRYPPAFGCVHPFVGDPHESSNIGRRAPLVNSARLSSANVWHRNRPQMPEPNATERTPP